MNLDPFEYEEEFHSQDNKEAKKNRKKAQNLDRSKYKKTDLDKKAKKTLVSKDNLKKARVLAIHGEHAVVDSDGDEFLCTIRGILKKEQTQDRNILAVGDIVYIQEENKAILFVEERKTLLFREENLRHKKQIIAANIDQVFITSSVVSPILKPSLIDRYIISANKGNVSPILVINKIDLLESNNKEKEKYLETLAAFEKTGIAIVSTSIKNNIGIDTLFGLMKNKTSVFSGQSGVGKSSLISLITGEKLKTGSIIAKTLKGAHITTKAQLIPLVDGGFCIDTPGIKSFGVWDLTTEDILKHFHDFDPFALDCKYPNCSHLNEPDCGVQKALEEKKISPLRFESYRSLIDSASKEKRHR